MNKKIVTNTLFIKEGKILLGLKKRGFGVGKFNGFGGKLEDSETVLDAAIRECREEVGLTPLDIEKVAEIHFAEDYSFAMHLFVCHIWTGKIIESDEMKPMWFDLNNLPYEQMWDDDKYWMPLVKQGKKFKAYFNFESDNDRDGTMINEVVSYKIQLVNNFK